MDILSLLLIAVGLSMDAFAVAVTSGFVMKKIHVSQALRIGLCFGLFQAIMPIIGWLAGLTLNKWITSYDHWIAFGLLTFVGIKMIVEALGTKEAEESNECMKLGTLIVLGIATSIDALAVGLSFAFLRIAIATPAIIIGLTTFGFSFSGVYLGKKMGHLFENKLEILGGLILIGIGLKILIQHL